MQFVHRVDAGDVGDVFFDVVEGDTGGDSLEKDLGCGLDERECGREDDDRDDKRDGRVEVHLPGVVCRDVHEAERDDHDADIAEGVTENVQEDTAHIEVRV